MSTDLTATTSLTWTNPDAEDDNPTVVHLTPDTLFLAVVPKKDLDQTVDTSNANRAQQSAPQTSPLQTAPPPAGLVAAAAPGRAARRVTAKQPVVLVVSLAAS